MLVKIIVRFDNINDKYTKAFKKYDYVNMNYFYKFTDYGVL